MKKLNYFKTFLAAMLLLCSNVTFGTTYWKIRVKVVGENNAEGLVGVRLNSVASYDYQSSEATISLSNADGYSNLIHIGAKVNDGDKRTVFIGWYRDEACTEKMTYGQFADIGNIPDPVATTTSSNEEDWPTTTFYAKFGKAKDPITSWTDYGVAPVTGQQYYIYSPIFCRFLYKNAFCVDNAADATLYTYTFKNGISYASKCPEGTTCNSIQLSFVDENSTKYYLQYNNSYPYDFKLSTYTWPNFYMWVYGDGTCGFSGSTANYEQAHIIQLNYDGTVTFPTTISAKNGIYWIFIPKDDYDALVEVKSVTSEMPLVVNKAPTASDTLNVPFEVSEAGHLSQFEATLTGGDGHFSLGTPVHTNDVFTVPVVYTATNTHSGTETPASSVTVTLTADNDANPSSKQCTVKAYVDLQPKFALKVNTLDWSRVGSDVVETYTAGAVVPASGRDRLKDKLVYDPEQTTGVAIDYATWTATIIGDDADQFQFPNGTQSMVCTPYSADALDVRFAPTKTGDFTATLRIVTSYKDVTNTSYTDTKDITLKGKALEESKITFAADGNQAPRVEESHNFGPIVGLNALEVQADLFIARMHDVTKTWVADEGSFEFDINSVDLTKTNQTLTFRAHRSEPVEETAVKTATLTISGKSMSEQTITATLTLTYTAQPWLIPEVTWNWSTIRERTTVTNPITTNSDGEWLLTKIDGAEVAYNAEELSASTPYLHHEVKTATFAFSMLPTDSFAAANETFVATISGPNMPIIINSADQVSINWQAELINPNAIIQSRYDGHNPSTGAVMSTSTSFNDATDVLVINGAQANIMMQGVITKLSFNYEKANGYNKWTISEYYKEGGDNALHNYAALPVGDHEYILMPNVDYVQIYANSSSKGNFSNIQLVEYDAIETNSSVVSMVESGATGLTPFNLSMTFANKRQVTVSLSETAAQYFELSAEGKATGNTIVFGASDGLGVGTLVQNKSITIALKDGINRSSVKGDCRLILADDYTYNHEVQELPIVLTESYTVTFAHDAHATYNVTYQDDETTPHAVSKTTDYTKAMNTVAKEHCTVVLDNLATDAGYTFQGWEINGNLVSCERTATLVITSEGTVKPVLGTTIAGNFQVDDAFFDDLTAALHAADVCAKKKVVIVKQDVTIEAGDYTIPAGVALLVPHKAECVDVMQYPEVVALTASTLAAYRTLTLKPGANIICNGTICVGGKILSASGGNKSAYVTGECGVINMANGGHIELNNKATLYCWGFIKGQDMDQGNNTQNVGTVTANNGATIWENFEVGDWRGGNASLAMYNYTKERKLFPFQSYSIQNIEVPTTYKYGSLLRNYTNVYALQATNGAAFSLIGSENTLFLLKDSESIIRKWYDPTTDLMCYELSGTAQLDALHIVVYVALSSDAYNLPIANNMHIILTNCEMTLAKPIMVQAGAIIEIKSDAIINLENSMHLFDVDEWGLYIHNYYFRSFNNLTSHKNRGAENSKAGLDDAKLIVDGTLNIVKDKGYLYATSGGAAVMGNHGGVINFKGALPTAGTLWQATVRNDLPYINWAPNPEDAANLHNEDGTYTKSYGGYTFYNVHGRWFDEENNNEKADHTYDFSYYPTNDVSGDETWTSAVYSHDKTGLEARMKWFNVTPDADCPKYNPDPEADLESDWWLGTNPIAYYNHTMLNEWHQFMATETEGVYSGSDNKLYQKEECLWFEEAAVDENCLYTSGGVKKALVDGHFIPLTSNGYDPAYHQTDDASKYFICFTGCNWHPATPYAGESKAYTINPETGVYLHYIWFNNDWLNVLRDEPFFYTEDEITNVRTYYEYVNGEWEIATPYVSVTDAAETRTFYMIKEAFNVAQIKKNATITLLRDLPNVPEKLTYETQNTTCTLDLNGHLMAGNIANLITINAPGATFTITDNSDLKIGKISNAANKAVNVTKGTLVVANGTIEATGVNAIAGAAGTTITITGGYFAANTKCVNGTGCSISGGHFNKDAGLATYAAAHKYPFETEDPKYKYEVSDAWTIIFKNGETTLQTLHLKPGEMPVYTENEPTKENQHFIGWSPTIVAATADATYTAQFEEVAAGSKCVTLNSNGGNEGLQYIYVTSGSAIGTLPETTKEGNTFAGWFTDATGGTQVSASTTVSADVTWYAHYSKNSYTLTWDANGGELSGSYTSGSVQYGTAITKPTATLEGHTFIGWDVTPATTMPAHDVTYTAQWSIAAKHYKQNLADDDYTLDVTENVTGEVNAYVTPAVKTYDGFISPAAQTVKIGETTEVTYNYARRTYTITLDVPEGSICETASVDVKHGATIESMPAATKEGHSFDGWFTKAVGGDQITNETVIQRNIGTLYAHFTELVTPETVIIVGNNEKLTITDPNMEATALIVEKDGIASFATGGHLTVDRLILVSTGNQSGQLVGLTASNLTVNGDVFFDFIPNGETGTQARTWYAVAVPWEVNAEEGIFWKEGNRQLIIGRDFDLIYYSGSERASVGNKPSCWKYVQNQSDKIMHPGRLYMMYFDPGWKTIRFKAQDHSALIAAAPGVEHHDAVTGQTTDANWNGIANPKVYHAYLNASGITYAQVLNNGNLDDYQAHNELSPVYSTITFSTYRFVVGKPVFVQATNDVAVSITPAVAPSLAPRRVRAAGVPEGAEAVYQITIAAEDRPSTDNLFIQTAEEKADAYVIGKDLAKGGVAKNNAQLWVNRYGVKLSVNTVAAVNGVYEYPLGLSIPTAGEYTIAIERAMGATEDLYLTRDGEAIWNLSNGAYVGSFEKGTHDNYGLRVSAHAPQITTGIDEAVVDAKGETRKVVINDKVYIIRGEHIYNADGQLVK